MLAECARGDPRSHSEFHGVVQPLRGAPAVGLYLDVPGGIEFLGIEFPAVCLGARDICGVGVGVAVGGHLQLITGFGDGCVGLVAARSDGSAGCFDVRAGFGVDPAAQVAQPVGALRAQRQSAAAPAVLLVEHRVRVEFLGDVAREFCDKPGVLFLGVAHQDPLCGVLLVMEGRG